MKLTKTEERLYEAFCEMKAIDCHEHLPPEKVRVAQKVDVFTLFAHYTRTDFVTAGMKPEQYTLMINAEEPLEKRWRIFRKFFPAVRHGSYARPALIAVKDIYGFDDITSRNYKDISEQMQADNKPGIYQKILGDRCNILVALTQAGRTDYQDDPLLTPLMPIGTYTTPVKTEAIAEQAAALEVKVKTIDDYIALAEKGILKWKNEGAVGLKMVSNPYPPGPRNEAVALFDRVLNGNQEDMPDLRPLHAYLLNQALDLAAKHSMVVACHTGMWGDFRTLDPTHVIPIIMAHPNTQFDLYHMGMPSVRNAGVMGKNFANCWLNLCWCHIISPEMTCNALSEWIDMVPVNKILGFGGDYGKPVEKAWGHLKMARQDIARVLGARVDRELMSIDEAIEIGRLWFYENPKRLYNLPV